MTYKDQNQPKKKKGDPKRGKSEAHAEKVV